MNGQEQNPRSSRRGVVTREDVIKAMAEAHFNCGGHDQIWAKQPSSAQLHDIRDMSAALDALESLGLAIVPREPTGDMKVAGGKAQQNSICSWGEPWVCYTAMLAASPFRKTDGEGT